MRPPQRAHSTASSQLLNSAVWPGGGASPGSAGEALSPLAVLSRGYAVAYRPGTRVPLTDASKVEIGERIRVRLHQGELGAVVRDGGRIPVMGPLFADGEEDS